jgi:hypothetical protein
MIGKKIWGMLVLTAVLGLVLAACTMSVSTEVSEAEIAEAIAESIDDWELDNLEVDLQDGYILVRAEKEHPDGSGTDSVSFRLDLGVSDSHLSATISQAQHNGAPMDQERVERWNERIAERLERIAQRRPNTTLQSVKVSTDKIVMNWQVTVNRGSGE